MRVPAVRRILAAGVVICAAASASLLAPAVAHATTAPSVDFQAHSRNSSETTVSFTVGSGDTGDVFAAYVSSDGPSGAAQTVTVTDNHSTTWNVVAQASGLDAEETFPGYAGIFSPSGGHHLSAGSYTITASQGTAGGQIFLEVVAYEGSAGLGTSGADGAASGSSGTALSITASAAGSLVYAVGHDWSQAGTPVAWSSPSQTIDNYYADTGNGDTSWVEYLDSPTSSASQFVSLGVTSPHGTTLNPDLDNLAMVEILGS